MHRYVTAKKQNFFKNVSTRLLFVFVLFCFTSQKISAEKYRKSDLWGEIHEKFFVCLTSIVTCGWRMSLFFRWIFFTRTMDFAENEGLLIAIDLCQTWSQGIERHVELEQFRYQWITRYNESRIFFAFFYKCLKPLQWNWSKTFK